KNAKQHRTRPCPSTTSYKAYGGTNWLISVMKVQPTARVPREKFMEVPHLSCRWKTRAIARWKKTQPLPVEHGRRQRAAPAGSEQMTAGYCRCKITTLPRQVIPSTQKMFGKIESYCLLSLAMTAVAIEEKSCCSF
ncbi:unnamed protein product, partial [Heterosigma akashiwo]